MRGHSLLLRVFFVAIIGSSCLLRASPAPEAVFQEAKEALAARNFTTALSRFESALSANPDNLRYASEYRQAVIQLKEHDRCLSFFAKLVADHPNSANVYLNYGFAYVDKIPTSGAITQVILANTALSHFSESIGLSPSWIAFYTRGNSYLFWPKIFNCAPLGVADLEKAMQIQRAEKQKSYHVRTYVSLGDGYWKMDNLEKARAVWKEGLAKFPNSIQLEMRLSKEGDELKVLIEDTLDPNKRVNTDLQELWMN
jgi:tetratricopeptide (TPR) repeat protein